MRLFLVVLTVCALFAPHKSMAQPLAILSDIERIGFTDDNPFFSLYVRGNARLGLRSMFIISANERKERAASLCGIMLEIGMHKIAFVTHMVELEAQKADSINFTPVDTDLCEEGLYLGVAHTHILPDIGYARVVFSESVDDPAFRRHRGLIDVVVWKVDRNFVHLSVRTKIGENFYRPYSVANCCYGR